MKEFVMMSPHVMPHPIVSQIMNTNPKHEHEHDPKTNAIPVRRSQANETS